MNILIKNGRVLDSANGLDEVKDIFVENGIVKEAGNPQMTIDAAGLWVVPGLIDMHVHLRDPGWPEKETITSGVAAAVAGGFTTICPMANTNPVTDSVDVVEYILSQSKNVVPIGSITKGLEGKELSPFAAMKAAGIRAISDDGKSVEDSALLKVAMEQAAALRLPVLSHCDDRYEADNILRDINLAKETGVRLHICHISTAEGAAHVRAAQKEGLPVTAEVCPHHFTLTSSDIRDANYKMSPPLRSQKDIEAIKEALADGTISVIATDHAPHHENDKNVPYEEAANGIIGLETAVPLCITELNLTPLELIAKLTINPARILGLDKGTLSTGKIADITIIDPNHEYIIDKETFRSKSRNTPFHRRKVRGMVKYTILEGRVVYDYRQAD
ncbi:MAG: dihydroorotase [Defluviitaleaceae bacterium]|nr:dihydroorotase [Defluviitaleaceae bacterium]